MITVKTSLRQRQRFVVPSRSMLDVSRQSSHNDGVDCSYGVCTYCLPIPTPSNPDAEKCATWTEGELSPLFTAGTSTPTPPRRRGA
jgi:hypothetical protein